MLHPKFQGPRWRTFRLLTLVGTGLSGIVPIAHGIQMFGFLQMVRQAGLAYYLGEGGIFLLAAAVYAVSQLPSRLRGFANNSSRLDFQSASNPAHLTFLVLLIRYSTSW
jgi:predicted membrane channel-forming protein YqfA (hemolysin III family)